MKKLILVITILFPCLSLYAQDNSDRPAGPPPPSHHHYSHRHHDEPQRHGAPPFSYIGFSTGFNNPSGPIGFDFDVPIARYVTIGAGGGYSTWGNKLHLDGKYYLRPHQRGWALGGGVTLNSGDNNFQTRRLMTTSGMKEKVYLNLHTQYNVFLAVYHYWSLGHRYNRFFTELGWSVPLVDKKFNEIPGTGDPLTQASRDKIDKLSPGGLVIGCGFSFGLHH